MAEILGQGEYFVSWVSIHSELDYEHLSGLMINPPPSDGRCTCCGRHLSELKRFGKAGDPLVGDFESALLVKRWRPIAPRDEEAERIYEEYLDRARRELRYEGAKQRRPGDSRRLEVEERTPQLRPPDRFKKMEDELSRLIILESNEKRVIPANCAMEQAGPIAFPVTEKAEPPSLAVMERAEQLMAQDLGAEVAQRILFLVSAGRTAESRWECRDCIVLSEKEYFERLYSRMKPGCRLLH
jgi:hypothetical protein